MIFHSGIDGAGTVDLFRQHQAGQLVGHGDPPHAELESGRPLDLVRQAVGGADHERHVPRPAARAVRQLLCQFLGGDLFSLIAHSHDGGTLADIAEDGFALFFQRLFHDGIGGVFLTKTCVDITNPKVIRATMGSIYRIPFFYVEDVVSLKQKLLNCGIRFFAAHLQGKNAYDRESYQGGTAFLIGNEGKGLPDQEADAADCLISIPICGHVESLNAAMAGGTLMYEAARQRRN